MSVKQSSMQRLRFFTRIIFFLLFLLAPPLDLLRFDPLLGAIIFFGQQHPLWLETPLRCDPGISPAFVQLLIRILIPILIALGFASWLAWRYGRLYCGWLCPHFPAVEVIDSFMKKALGRRSLWSKKSSTNASLAARSRLARTAWWGLIALAAIGSAFVWAVALLSYIWPPSEVYQAVLSASPSRFQLVFLSTATLLFSLDLLFARHLFCRYLCSVGLFQSLLWMSNKAALRVGFKRERVKECISCQVDCEQACPMQLKPRASKRHLLSCTQCGLCLQACEQVQNANPRGSLLNWVDRENHMAGADSRRDGDIKPMVRDA